MLSEASHCINFLEVWGEGNDLVRNNRYHLNKLKYVKPILVYFTPYSCYEQLNKVINYFKIS